MKFHWFHKKEKPEPQPLRIEGVGEAPMTAEPDDAELAAQALLEMMKTHPLPLPIWRGVNTFKRKGKPAEEVTTPLAHREGQGESLRGSAYYHALADKIRTAQEAARLRTLRFLAFVEQELAKKELPLTGPGSLGLLEAELMKRLDVIERHGGELKTRWQHCVAEVMVRMMKANDNLNDNDNDNEKAASEREQSDARIDSAEREQARPKVNDNDNGSSQAPQN